MPQVSFPAPEAIERDLSYLVRMTSLIMLSVLAISWRIYIPGFRIFAEAPLVPGFSLPALEYALFALSAGSLAWLLRWPCSRRAACVLAVATVAVTLQDVSRLQPYILMYVFTIVAAVFWRNQGGLDALRVMVCGVYFWAGFHKLNVTFLGAVFPWFVSSWHHLSDPLTLLDNVEIVAGIITPVFEMLIGILLLAPQCRRLATLMAFVMLVVVLACIGPLGHRWAMVVWPWNVYLFLMEYRLFMGCRSVLPWPRKMPKVAQASFAVFGLAPVMAIFTPWYAQPGFKLYSGNIDVAFVLLPPEETLARAPAFFKKEVLRDHRLPLIEWSVLELGTGLYPVPYVFKTGAAGLCPYLDHPEKATLRMYAAPPFYRGRKEHEDVPLCGR